MIGSVFGLRSSQEHDFIRPACRHRAKCIISSECALRNWPQTDICMHGDDASGLTVIILLSDVLIESVNGSGSDQLHSDSQISDGPVSHR